MRWVVAALLLIFAAAPATADKRIALTFDDVPRGRGAFFTPDERTIRLIAGLHKAGVKQAAFYLVPGQIGHDDGVGGEQRIEAYVAAGHVIADHSFTHPHLSELSVADYMANIDKAEAFLKGREGRRPWFRYPFLDEGQDPAQRVAGRQVLARHGYRVADVTTGFSDWAWTPAYARCTAKHDRVAVARLEQMYLAAVRQSIAVDRETARRLYGRDIPYVLLMHVSAMSAHMMPQVLRLYRDAGYRFVSLPKAESAPVYRSDIDLSLAPASSRGELAKARGVKLPEPIGEPAALTSICL